MGTTKSNTQVASYRSKSLDYLQPYSYCLPSEISPGGTTRYPVLIMLHGFDGCHTSWLQHTRISDYLSRYGIIAVFPHGSNGWYSNSFDGSLRHEDDIVQDLIPEIVRTMPVEEPGNSWAIGGMSMGGYGAISLALKYPELFGCAFSHGGAMDRMLRTDVHPVFGDPERDRDFRKRANPVWLAEQILCRFPVQRPRLLLDCGLSDPLLESNRAFSNHLNYLGYHHTYVEAPGHHTWPYWNRAFRTVLPRVAECIGAEEHLSAGI